MGAHTAQIPPNLDFYSSPMLMWLLHLLNSFTCFNFSFYGNNNDYYLFCPNDFEWAHFLAVRKAISKIKLLKEITITMKPQSVRGCLPADKHARPSYLKSDVCPSQHQEEPATPPPLALQTALKTSCSLMLPPTQSGHFWMGESPSPPSDWIYRVLSLTLRSRDCYRQCKGFLTETWLPRGLL